MTIPNIEDTTEPSTDRKPCLIALTKVIFYKQLILLLRYPLNTISQFLAMFFFFAVIFFGGQAVGGPALTNSLNGIIVGFFLFTLSISSYSGIARNVTREAQWGTLERLFMSPHGFGTVMAVKTIVNISINFVWSFMLLLLMFITTGRWLTIDPLTVIPLTVLTLMSVVGLGFLCAGLALVYKRIENLFQLIQFMFIGLIAAPVGRVEWLKFLPVTLGSHLIQIAMEDGIRLWEFPIQELSLLTVTGVTYMMIGYYCFYRAGIKARKEGLMGHY